MNRMGLRQENLPENLPKNLPEKFRAQLFLTALTIICVSSQLQARVFDFNRENFAVYVGGSFGNSNLGDGAYGLSSGWGTSTDRSVQTTTAAEFGFIFAATRVNLLLGVEYLMPRDQTTVNGSDTAGNQLFSLHSTVTALIPQATLEFITYRGPNSRLFLGLGYGYAMVSLSNQYAMTAAGTTELGVGSYKESGSATSSLYKAYLGWEFLFTDNVTLTFDAGYRYLIVPTISASQSAIAIGGSESQGANLTNMDGSNRSLNLGGGFLGLSLRFYL